MSRGLEAQVVLLNDAQNGVESAAAGGGDEVGEGVLGVGGFVVRKHGDCCSRQQGRGHRRGRWDWWKVAAASTAMTNRAWTLGRALALAVAVPATGVIGRL